jgi:hypothetical protein
LCLFRFWQASILQSFLKLHVRLQVANFHQELKQVENKIVSRYFQTPANLRQAKDQTIEKLS